jgi:AcrR family transcriptional regulator
VFTEYVHFVSNKPTAGEKTLRARQKSSTRDAIFAAAREVLAEKGLAGMQARDLAGRANVAVGTIFLHFSSLSGLVENLLDEHLKQALQQAFAQLPDAPLLDRLTFVCSHLIRAYLQEPELSRACVQASLFEAVTQVSHDRMAGFRQWFLAELERHETIGGKAIDDREGAFFAFFSLYFGAVVVALRTPDRAQEALDTLRRSLTRFFSIASAEER